MRGLKQKNNDDTGRPVQSHLLQMRGLKPFIIVPLSEGTIVASFTDAWIETLVNYLT